MKTLIISIAAIALLLTANYSVKSGNPEQVSPIFKIGNMNSQVEKRDTLVVQGKCGMCKTRIEKAAKSVKGVSLASWNLDTKKLEVEYDSSRTSIDTISKAVAKVGHDTEKDKAEKKVYDALPACCKYR